MESKPLVVVGAGISGTAAAIEVARAGVRVTLVDENPLSASMMGLNVPQFFGQRFTDAPRNKALTLERVAAANEALAEAEEAGVDVQLGTCVWGAFRNTETSQVLDGPQLGLADDERSWLMKFDRLIVAAGARDLGIAFAGWDLAGAMGANGAHSLMSLYRALSSRRMVVLGSGNLGLNTARMALDSGMEVAAVVDVSSSVRGDGALSTALRGRGRGAVHLPHRQGGGRQWRRHRVRRADRDRRQWRAGGRLREGYRCRHRVPRHRPGTQRGAPQPPWGASSPSGPELGGYVPDRDDWMRTSVDSVFVAGDAAGFHDGMVLDPKTARNQGRLAGVAAAESLGAIDKEEALARRSDLRTGAGASMPTEVHSGWKRWLQSLVDAGGRDVFVCRCEEVTCAELVGLQPPRYLGWSSEQMDRRSLQTLLLDGPVNPNQVKRLTRAGTGHCQGRLCREQMSLLLAEESGTGIAGIPLMSYRPPVRPLPLRVMWPHDETDEVRRDWPKWFSPTNQVLG